MKKWTAMMGFMLMVLTLILPQAAAADELVNTKGQIVAGVSFRDQPSTSSNVLRYLKTNEVVTVTDIVNSYWYQVKDAQGVSGYVSSNAKYIKIISNAKIIYGVNLRTLPTTDGSKVIRMLSKGEEVLVLEKTNDSWYKIQDMNGTTGYMSSSSKYIVTDFTIATPNMSLEDQAEAVIAAGMTYLGTPYEYGSERFNPTTFDCSDFTQTAFWDALRVMIPSDSQAQGDYVRSLGNAKTDWQQLKRGDLMFFSSYKGWRDTDYAGMNSWTEPVTHVGIYLGNGQILHTYSIDSGGVVVESMTDKQWAYRFLYGGSALQ
ncbi:C40 family peptidase [Paenibacillus hexagrammi]|uniref:SH3 domain-containing protein n=1 Tax=Paenibacillus hexagrammi TaxID=2908839 RepID=A0ABY3SN07_9BACL|nr:C40 family peptidase [Paenibacillus sp. YPD9-1]UJF35423.1 SH3 domain-containing protein [Paenibacillus sp. YPD9-1]